MVAATVFHAKTATAPDDPTYNILPSDWNSSHTVSVMLQPADFANSNGVTFGVNGAGVVTATVAAGGAAQTGISGIAAVGGTATSGTVSFANSNGVSWGMNGQSMTATVKTDYQTSGAYLTTAALSQDSSKYAGTSTGATNASVTLNTAGIAVSVAAAVGQTSLSFANSNGVSFGIAGSTITATVATNYQSSGAYLTTAALSQDSSKYAGINGAITGGSITVNTSGVSVNLPAYLTTARGSTDAIGLNTAGTNITWTANSSGLSINAAGYAGTTTAITGAASITLNSAGLNFNIGAYITTGALSGDTSKYIQNWKLTGNSAGTQSSAAGTDLWLAGGQGITLSGSSNSISFSVGSYITTGDLSANSSNYARNWKLTGNSAGTQSSAIGTDLWLAGGQGITLSGSSNSISFSVGSYITTARASTDAVGLNTANTNVTWTVNSSGISINAAGYAGTGTSATNASITLNTAGLAISVAAAAGATVSYYKYPDVMVSNDIAGYVTGSSNLLTIQPLYVPNYISASFIRQIIQWGQTSTSFATTANTTFSGAISTTYWAIMYSLGAGASSRSLQSVYSGSALAVLQLSVQANANGSQWTASSNVTYPSLGSTTSTQFTEAKSTTSFQFSTQNMSNFSATRYFDIPFATLIAPGAYWLGLAMSSASATQGTAGITGARWAASRIMVITLGSSFTGIGAFNAATAVNNLPQLGVGSFTTNAATTASLLIDNVSSWTATTPFIIPIEIIRQV